MKRREFVASFAAHAAALAAVRERCAAADKNIKWAVSMFLWTSTQWPGKGPVPFTEMLDVIKDTGFNGFRFTGWPGSLERYGLTLPMLDRELSKRDIGIATVSFGGQASDAGQHDKIAASAHEACKFLQHFGARLSPSSLRRARTKSSCGST